jgi:hypothetical protein
VDFVGQPVRLAGLRTFPVKTTAWGTRTKNFLFLKSATFASECQKKISLPFPRAMQSRSIFSLSVTSVWTTLTMGTKSPLSRAPTSTTRVASISGSFKNVPVRHVVRSAEHSEPTRRFTPWTETRSCPGSSYSVTRRRGIQMMELSPILAISLSRARLHISPALLSIFLSA